jgi:Fe-Mn family superoxide dismutase
MNRAISFEVLFRALKSAKPPLVIDVRRAPVFEMADELIAGADWRDPAHVDAWSVELARSSMVVVYCVHGHQVSQGCASRLEELGFDARFLEGGFEGWKLAGGAVACKAGGSS